MKYHTNYVDASGMIFQLAYLRVSAEKSLGLDKFEAMALALWEFQETVIKTSPRIYEYEMGLMEITKDFHECPRDDWELPCGCHTCMSYGI